MNNKPHANSQIQFYIRTAKKLGFLAKSKKNILTNKQIKQIAQNKTKIPPKNQVLYYNGQQIEQNAEVKLVDKSIVHVLDSRNIGKSKMKLLVKRLPNNSQIDSFQVDSDASIDSFIKNSLSGFYQQPAEKLFFVYTGRQLNKQKSFKQQHVQSQSQIFCVHEDKDQKRKDKASSPQNSQKSLKTEDTEKNKQLNENKKEVFLENQKQKLQNQQQGGLVTKKLQVKENTQRNSYLNDFKSGDTLKQQEATFFPQDLLPLQARNIQSQKTNQQNRTSQPEQKPQDKKIIKSIDQIKCVQYESDEDSDNQIGQEKGYNNNIPKKLPQDYLVEQTRQRSYTKQNNSQTSSISQPNFKKKKKVSEIQVTSHHNSNKKSDGESSKSPIEKLDHDQINEQLRLDTEKRNSSQTQIKKNIKTRQQIFDFHTNTYSSVIDESQSSSHQKIEETFQNPRTTKSQETVLIQRQCMFNSYTGQNENQVFDSQMVYDNFEGEKPQIKYNKGFMNLSDVNILQNDSYLKNYNQASYGNRNEGVENQYQVKSHYDRSNYHKFQELNINRAPELREAASSQEPSPQNQSRICREGDSLSFSKSPSQINGHRQPQQSEDNLFIQYRRGYQTNIHNNYQNYPIQNQQILIQQQQISQSNLLSNTYGQPNVTFTEQYNSITFNLQPNPDQKVPQNLKAQSSINIDPQLEQVLPEQYQNNQFVDQKRESELQTNFRDSPDPSQITSNPSSQINLHHGNSNSFQLYNGFTSTGNNFYGIIESAQNQTNHFEENKHNFNQEHETTQIMEPMSLIENLIQMMDIKITVNQVKSQDSCDQVDEQDRKHFIQNHSDISYHSQKNDLQNIYNTQINHQETEQISQKLFVSYQAYNINKQTYDVCSDLCKENQPIQNYSYNSYNQNNSISQLQKSNQNLNDELLKKQYATYDGNANEDQNISKSAAFYQISQYCYDKNQQMQEIQYQPNRIIPKHQEQQELTFRKDNSSNILIFESSIQCQNTMSEPTFKVAQDVRNSDVLNGLQQTELDRHIEYKCEQQENKQSCSINNRQDQDHQLLPGDYIYSSDKIQNPDEILDNILDRFTHCF